MIIFRASITINGVTYYAKNYGKKAFPIKIGAGTANQGKALPKKK